MSKERAPDVDSDIEVGVHPYSCGGRIGGGAGESGNSGVGAGPSFPRKCETFPVTRAFATEVACANLPTAMKTLYSFITVPFLVSTTVLLHAQAPAALEQPLNTWV